MNAPINKINSPSLWEGVRGREPNYPQPRSQRMIPSPAPQSPPKGMGEKTTGANNGRKIL